MHPDVTRSIASQRAADMTRAAEAARTVRAARGRDGVSTRAYERRRRASSWYWPKLLRRASAAKRASAGLTIPPASSEVAGR